MNLTLQQIGQALSLPLTATGTVTGWSIDTRTLVSGDLFVALKGPNHDGHDHVEAAFAKGAAAAIVSAPPFRAATEGSGELLIQVPDTLKALQTLAAWARSRWPGQVIGVTGSAGKTTTKEIIARLLATTYKTGKTEGNFNNHVGLPLSILRLAQDSQFAVLELGMNHLGEIRDLAQIAKPRVAVVTNVGPAHIENFPDGLTGIASAKRELVNALPADGLAVLNADDPYVAAMRRGRTITYGINANADVKARNLRLLDDHVEFSVENEEISAPVAGRHNVLNILAGIAVGLEYGVKLRTLAIAAAEPIILKMRGERKVHNGVTIWDDCYNANPDAMRAMLDVLQQTSATRRIAVLGEMRELGTWSEEFHTQVGKYAASANIDYVIAIHGDAKYTAAQHPSAQFVDDPESAGDLLKKLVRPGDAVLFKGSRGTHVERALERYLA